MRKILSFQHWQLFILISIRIWTPPSPFELITSVIAGATILTWLYSVVIYGAEIAEKRGLYSVSRYGFNVPRLIIQACTLYTVFGTFYSMAAAAKTITSLTQGRNVPFKDYFLVFFIILFFLAGVWVIQPKVNKLIA